MCSPKLISSFPLEHKIDYISQSPLQLGGSQVTEFWPIGCGWKWHMSVLDLDQRWGTFFNQGHLDIRTIQNYQLKY